MSFLAPLFFLGALAIALPILFHLIRRRVKERTIFSSLMFLLPSPPRLTRRSRFEHLLLLALRCLILALLAAGFARPFLKRAVPQIQAAEPAKRVVVLLDTSASMRRPDLWSAARARAEEILRKAGPEDAVALFTFDRQLRSLMTFEQWSQTPSGDRLSLARNRLADVQPGWGSTALDSALIQAAEMFADQGKREAAGERRIVVISDFQEGSRTAALQGYQWPKGVQVLQERVAARPANNASLQLLAEMTAGAPTTTPAVRVRMSTAADSKQEQCRVGWADASGAYVGQPVEVYAPAGQSRMVALPAPATNLPVGRILLTGDDEPFDNSVWTVPPEKSQVKVVYWGDDLEGDARQPLFFLQRALQDTPRQAIRFVRARPATPLSGAEVDGAALAVVTTSVGETQVAQLREVLARGGTLLLVPKTAEAATSLGRIWNVELPPATERKLEGYAMLADINFNHPLFAPFADARFSDFTKLHFWNYRKMDFSAVTNAQTLARFDTGDPAIVSIPIGKGRVVVFTSGWQPADSQLALSSKFVPLLYSLMDLCNAEPPAPAQHFVGDPLSIGPLENATTAATIQLPQRGTATLAAGATNFVALEPGIYTAVSSKGTIRFAVNLEPAESRTAPMPTDELDRLGVPGPVSGPVAVSDNQSKVRLQNEEMEDRQKLWRWILVAALGLLGLETWLAGWTTRQTARTEEAA